MSSSLHDPDESPLNSEPLPRPTNVRWLIFLLACGSSMFLYLHRYTFNFIKPELAREYKFDETSLGAMFGLFNLSYGFGQIPSGIACDFLGTHLFLAILIVAWSLMLAGFGATGNFYALGAMRLLFGGAQAGCYPILSKVTRTWFPRKSRTVVQGIVATFCGRLGGALSSIVMATLLMGLCGLSWRAALWVMAGAGVLFGLLFLFLFRESPRQDPRVNDAERDLISEGQSEQTTGGVLPFGQALRNRSLLALCLQQWVAAGADTVYQSLLGSFFLDRFGVNLSTAGLLVSLPMFGGAIGGLTGGLLNDLLGRFIGNRWARSCVGFTGPIIASALVFVFLQQPTALAAALALFAVKFFVDWSQPTVWGTCTDLGGRYTATIFSIINTTGTLGGFVFPLLFGVLLDYNKTLQVVDDETLTRINYDPLFFLIALMYVGSGSCWFLIDCTKKVEK